MEKLKEDEIVAAFLLWYRSYRFQEIDEAIVPYLNQDIKAYESGQKSWLKSARKATFLSVDQVAKNLQISRAAYSKFEDQEEKGSITLETLARAAQAMDCELVYGIRMQSRRRFSFKIWNALAKISLEHGWLMKCDQRKRANALAAIAKNYMESSQFKKSQGWSKRANEL
jgi:transcriptional regulator with XRE-family HTH domain